MATHSTAPRIGAPSTYVVDFNNNVSMRMYSVELCSRVLRLGRTVTCGKSAVNCAPGRRDVQRDLGRPDTRADVLVKIGNGAER